MVTPSFDLSGRVALITGGGSGLGFAMAEAMAGHGAKTLLVGRNAERLQSAVAQIEDAGGAAVAIACDLLDRAALATMVEDTLATHGAIDILVNNAGIQHRQAFVDFEDDAWERMIATNLSVPFRMAKTVGHSMIARGSGKIINILSLLSDLGRPSVVPYAAAKGGLKMLTRGLATEFGPKNVQVNGIAPGYFATEMNAALRADADFTAWLESRTPAGRWGQPSELGGAAVFLASPASDFVTGHVLTVDGGLTASL